jgi:hypothetical protein
VPEIVTFVFAATVKVVTGKVALVAPAGTVTLAGTVATAVLLLASVTTAPPAGAGPVSVAVPVDGFPPWTLVGLNPTELRLAGPPTLKCGRTAIQSRKKSRAVELDTSITRARKLALPKSDAFHVRPHVSTELPSVNVDRLVPSVPVAFAAVQLAPPSHESCTHIFGALAVLSARASRRTSMPLIVAPAGTEKP